MDVMSAVKAPLRKDYLINAVLIPAAWATVCMVIAGAVFSVLCLKAFQDLMAAHQDGTPLELTGLMGVLPGVGLALVISMVSMIPVMGYYWELIRRLVYEGPNAPAPEWKSGWQDHFKSGMQAFIAFAILFVPMAVLCGLSFGLAFPFFMTPFVMAAREKTCKRVLQLLKPSLRMTQRHYVPLLIGYVICFVASIVYSMVQSIVAITVVGPMVVAMACHITCSILLAECYSKTGMFPRASASYDYGMSAMPDAPEAEMPQVATTADNTMTLAYTAPSEPPELANAAMGQPPVAQQQAYNPATSTSSAPSYAPQGLQFRPATGKSMLNSLDAFGASSLPPLPEVTSVTPEDTYQPTAGETPVVETSVAELRFISQAQPREENGESVGDYGASQSENADGSTDAPAETVMMYPNPKENPTPEKSGKGAKKPPLVFQKGDNPWLRHR